MFSGFAKADDVGASFSCRDINSGGDLYSGCNDILNGERVFLPLDDLAISQVYEEIDGLSTNLFLLDSTKNEVVSQPPVKIAGGAPIDSGSKSLKFGRFVKRGVFDTKPNAEQGVLIGPNDNFAGNFCPDTGPGEFLVMNFFRAEGRFDCDALPTALPFSSIENTGMVWSTIVADFNKDGLDDLFVNYLPDGGYRIFSFEAVESHNFTDEMTSSAEGTGLFMVGATAGDFDGDGQLEIAGVQNAGGNLELVVLELTYDAQGNVAGFMPPIIIDGSQLGLAGGVGPGKSMAITSGDFDSSDPFVDEIVVAAQNNQETMNSVAILALKLNLEGACSNADTSKCIAAKSEKAALISNGIGANGISTPIRLKTKKMLQTPDLVVFGVNIPEDLSGSVGSFFHISVLHFANGIGPLDFGLISTEQLIPPSENGVVCLHDVDIGNFNLFDNSIPDIRVAALFANSDNLDCSNILLPGKGNNPRIVFFILNGGSLVQNSVLELNGGFTTNRELAKVEGVTSFMNLEAGDLQGRSTLLGNPTKVVINNNLQPAVVIKSPPMHVTTLLPPENAQNNVNPDDNAIIGNIITAYPNLFNAEFGSEITADESFSQMGNTSFTISTRQGSPSELIYRIPTDSLASTMFNAAANQVHNAYVSSNFDPNFNLVKIDTLKQRFDDEILTLQNRQNVWSYPIIGPQGIECSQCEESVLCPGLLGCAEGAAPLVLNISAPDMINFSVGSTVNVEWYQPPEVPGNVLTYPWTLAQLQQQVSGFLPLSSTVPLEELAGSEEDPILVPWTIDNASTAGYSSLMQPSFDTSFSSSGVVDIFSVDEDSSLTIDYNQSNAFSTLFESHISGSPTQGFTINRPSFPDSGLVQYPFRYYIFGQSPVNGTVQENPGENLTVTGPLFLGFEANPASIDESEAGPWWFNTYRDSGKSDIALNLPAQWDWITSEGDPDNPKQFRFIQNSDTSGLFYFMKSFFAVPAGQNTSCPSSVPGSQAFSFGPQRTTYTDGDDILLCLRVYNLSLNEFPEGSQPKVRLYRREWDPNQGHFAAGSENILIDEINLPAIPGAGADGFGNQDASDAPNWVYASTVLDTSGLAAEGDVYFKFWAVTWTEDSSGELINELDNLGINSIPPQNVSSHRVILTEPFSNNVGVYNQIFVVKTQQGDDSEFPNEPPGDDPGPISLTTNGLGDPVFIQSLTAFPGNVVPGDRSELDLVINNIDTVPHDVILLYYDGDPLSDGRLFDMEVVPRVKPQETFKVKNTYLPRSCGNHQIFVGMFSDDGSVDIALADVSRDCPSVSITESLYIADSNQLVVSGSAGGVLRGSDIELFNANNFAQPIAVISENELGINNGLSTYNFTINDLNLSDAPCLVRVVNGSAIDQRNVDGKDNCEPIIDDPDTDPIIGPTPTPEPSPTPVPGVPPIDPDDDNVADVEGVFIVSPVGTRIDRASRVFPQCPNVINGEEVDYPLDFFTYEVTNINEGESIQVSLFIPEGTEPIDTFLKFGPTPDNPEPHCYEFLYDGVTGAQFLPNGEIRITFVDGLRGDSDLTVNGIITDPGGPAVIRDAEAPQIGVGDCSLARTSQPVSSLISLLIPLLAALFAGLRSARRARS